MGPSDRSPATHPLAPPFTPSHIRGCVAEPGCPQKHSQGACGSESRVPANHGPAPRDMHLHVFAQTGPPSCRLALAHSRTAPAISSRARGLATCPSPFSAAIAVSMPDRRHRTTCSLLRFLSCSWHYVQKRLLSMHFPAPTPFTAMPSASLARAGR